MQVGFIGLGAMGGAMARNLISAGHSVRAWNRSGNPGIDGLDMVSEPAEALRGEAAFTMLSDDLVVRQVLIDGGALSMARPGLVHVVAATISVDFSEELTGLHEAAGLGYVAAPVLGRPDVAARGELNILAAGRSESVERVRPLLDVLGKKVWDMGEVPKRANAAKLAANMMIAMVIESMAEAVAITEANGLSREIFFDLILNALFGGRSYQTYSSNIAQRKFEPGFKARLGLKDLQLATAAAEACGGQLPMLDAVRSQMIKAVDAGWGERDWSVMSEILLGDTSGERR